MPIWSPTIRVTWLACCSSTPTISSRPTKSGKTFGPKATATSGAFTRGLIQAAVGLFHFGGGNLGGAVKLYRSSRDYMRPCGSPFLGLDADAFWRRMEECFRPLLTRGRP